MPCAEDSPREAEGKECEGEKAERDERASRKRSLGEREPQAGEEEDVARETDRTLGDESERGDGERPLEEREGAAEP